MTLVEDRPIMSVKYCLPVRVFYFWRNLLRTLQRGLSAIAEHLVKLTLKLFPVSALLRSYGRVFQIVGRHTRKLRQPNRVDRVFYFYDFPYVVYSCIFSAPLIHHRHQRNPTTRYMILQFDRIIATPSSHLCNLHVLLTAGPTRVSLFVDTPTHQRPCSDRIIVLMAARSFTHDLDNRIAYSALVDTNSENPSYTLQQFD